MHACMLWDSIIMHRSMHTHSFTPQRHSSHTCNRIVLLSSWPRTLCRQSLQWITWGRFIRRLSRLRKAEKALFSKEVKEFSAAVQWIEKKPGCDWIQLFQFNFDLQCTNVTDYEGSTVRLSNWVPENCFAIAYQYSIKLRQITWKIKWEVTIMTVWCGNLIFTLNFTALYYSVSITTITTIHNSTFELTACHFKCPKVTKWKCICKVCCVLNATHMPQRPSFYFYDHVVVCEYNIFACLNMLKVITYW